MTGTVSRPTVTTPSIGQPIKRKEDARLLTGATNWTDNIQLPGTLHMEIVRSPFAHAKITRIDVTAALAMPGVVAAFGAEELGADNAKVLGRQTFHAEGPRALGSHYPGTGRRS